LIVTIQPFLFFELSYSVEFSRCTSWKENETGLQPH